MKHHREDWHAAQRVALLSDTHGRLADGIVAGLAIYAPDLIIHAGDVGAGEVLRLLATIAPVRAVAGNNDDAAHWQGRDLEVLAELPDILELALPGGDLVVVHGHQCRAAARRHAWLRQRFAAARVIGYGHSHRRVIDDTGRPVVVNPGAAGRARAFGGAGWLMLGVTDPWRFEPAVAAAA